MTAPEVGAKALSRKGWNGAGAEKQLKFLGGPAEGFQVHYSLVVRAVTWNPASGMAQLGPIL